MKRTILCVATSLVVAACTGQPDVTVPTSPAHPTIPGQQVTLPSLGGAMPMLQSGSITLTADTGPGNATIVAATRFVDDRSAPPSVMGGGGSYSVTLAGVAHAGDGSMSFFDVMPDDAGTDYLVIGLLDDASADHVSAVYAVVKASDFAPGAAIALDGVDRYAVFASGPIDGDAPELVAIATSGTLHLGATADLAGAIDATLDGTFTRAELAADPPDPTDPSGPPDGGAPDVPPTTLPAAGAYQLHVGGLAEVRCDGALAGKEGDFQGIAPADWGFADTAVQLDASTGTPILSGAGLQGAFGQTSLELVPDETGSAWYGASYPTDGRAGPDGTVRAGVAVVVDFSGAADPQNAGVALFFALPDRSGQCVVQVDATITP